MLDRLKTLFTGKPVAQDAQAVPASKPPISSMAVANARVTKSGNPFTPMKPMAGVLPAGALAMDSAFEASLGYAMTNFAWHEGLMFTGYAELSNLSQRPEFRKPAEIVAKEMTRKWIKFQGVGEDDKADKIKQIEDEFKRLDVQSKFRKLVEQENLFGRSQIFVDTGSNDNPNELRVPLLADKAKLGKGDIKGLRVVEPIWTHPSDYNSMHPLEADFFQPKSWYVMGKEVHHTRLLTYVSRQVPDILKPAYMFGGLSLTQILKPYVDNWLRTRQSVSDMLHTYSVNGLKTDMSSVLQEGGAGQSVVARAQLFNAYRDNRGLLLVDKDNEEFFNVSAPLGGLDHLQAQAQEQMASIAGIPLVVLLKITPSGLNATSDGEIRTFYDWIAAQQEQLNPLVEQLLRMVQVSLFGEIDDEIVFHWEPLWSSTETEAAAIRKQDCDTDIAYLNAGVISGEEVRARIAKSETSLYAGLDIDQLPEDHEDNESSNAGSDTA